MDSHIRWLKRLMVPRLLTRIGIEFVVVAELILIGLLTAGVGRLLAISWAIVLGQLVTAVRVSVSMMTNAVNKRFLDKYTNSVALVRTVQARHNDEGHSDEAAEFFAKYNMVPVGAIEVVTGDGTSWSDAYATADGYVLGSIAAGSPHPTVVSALSDGRFLLSTHQLVPPNEMMIVNHVRRANARQLLESHVDVLEKLHGAGVEPITAGADAIAATMRFEHAAWCQLGPYLGPFLAIGTSWQPLALQTRVPATTILEKGIESTITLAVDQPGRVESAGSDTLEAAKPSPEDAPSDQFPRQEAA